MGPGELMSITGGTPPWEIMTTFLRARSTKKNGKRHRQVTGTGLRIFARARTRVTDS